MGAWKYLIGVALLAGILVTPALIVMVFGHGSFDDALFVVLAALLIVSALAVVTLRDIIRCGLAMIVCFSALAGIYVVAGAPLVAAAQVLVYVGAISVLVLFAIMLTQSKRAPARLVFQTQAAPAAVLAVLVAVLLGLTAISTNWGEVDRRVRLATDTLATVLFRDYVLAFEIVSVLLLMAVVGGVFLAKREGRGQS
jgi:NADH:ubiquinone oxidoreductase subunit 6 (subunit J)